MASTIRQTLANGPVFRRDGEEDGDGERVPSEAEIAEWNRGTGLQDQYEGGGSGAGEGEGVGSEVGEGALAKARKALEEVEGAGAGAGAGAGEAFETEEEAEKEDEDEEGDWEEDSGDDPLDGWAGDVSWVNSNVAAAAGQVPRDGAAPKNGKAPSDGEDPLLAPGLYLVGTPIGNLEDITLRALRVLRTADAVLAEDTRHTKRLLQRYGIDCRLVSYHAHNERQR